MLALLFTTIGAYAQQQGTTGLPISEPYSGAVAVAAAVNSSSHAQGTSLGGLITVPIATRGGGGGALTGISWTSPGGATVAILIRIWQRLPANTTCTDNTAYVGSSVDDKWLVTPPLAVTPAVVAPNTGDAKTYGNVSFSANGAGLSFKNSDIVATNNLYVCVVTNATDTADQSSSPWITLSGILN
jgi:hypothetical protein